MIGFQRLYGPHNADNLAAVAFALLKRADILDIVSNLLWCFFLSDRIF